MAKEIYLYYPIYDFVIQDLMTSIEENKTEDITMRVNSPGGSVYAAYGLFAKMREHGNINLKVDGSAMSGSALTPLYAKTSECLDVTRFLFHRADMFVENGEDQAYLDGINKDLLKQMKMKLDENVFTEVTGFTFADLFDPEKRIDITITGPEAKKIGLVQKVVKLTPEMKSSINADYQKRFSVAAFADPIPTPKKTKKNTAMNASEFQKKYPKTFARVFAMGATQEKERIEAVLEYIDVDAEGVKKIIDSGKAMTPKQMSEFNIKMMNKGMLEKVKGDGTASPVQTSEAEKAKTEKEKEVNAFSDDVKKRIGIK